MLDESYIDYIIQNKRGGEMFQDMRNLNARIFDVLEAAFASFKVQLIDFKLEYGLIDGKATVIDEITGGSFRLWPYASDNPDLSQPNILNQLDPAGRLDKDNYRLGGSLEQVQSKFVQIASITAGFKNL